MIAPTEIIEQYICQNNLQMEHMTDAFLAQNTVDRMGSEYLVTDSSLEFTWEYGRPLLHYTFTLKRI